MTPTDSTSPRRTPPAVLAWASLGLAAVAAAYLASGQSAGAVAALVAHAGLFLGGVAGLVGVTPRVYRLPALLLGLSAMVLGGLNYVPALSLAARQALTGAHVAAGLACIGVLLWPVLMTRGGTRQRIAQAVGLALLLGAGGAYGAMEWSRTTWQPPRYDSEACYRFLTATTRSQSGEASFPSALRITGKREGGCTSGGCHTGVHAEWQKDGHALSGSSSAYQATFQDFVGRRGAEAGRWCQGCHNPEALKPGGTQAASGVTCVSCHGATNAHALYGSAALEVRASDAPATRLEALFRPKAHAARNLRPDLHLSAEFCGSCHRKAWNLPQNGYRWMPGPDEYREWQTSRFSGAALYAPGEPAAPRSCGGCHDAHGIATPRAAPTPSGMELDLFLRRPGLGGAAPLNTAPQPTLGEEVLLDVVVRNEGIGHDFPTGMPDLNEAWLEVRVSDRAGKIIGTSGADGKAQDAHHYRQVGLDRQGQPILHGAQDQRVAIAEGRRIRAGEADLARYRLSVPKSGLGTVIVSLWRRRVPEFQRWLREPEVPPRLLAQTRLRAGEAQPAETAVRWRRYGTALAAVKAYPQAIQALTRAVGLSPSDGETALALGQVFLEEGDLLAAREQFGRARGLPGVGDRARAWEADVMRNSAQYEAAVGLLEPLARRSPRDVGLRFQLGQAYFSLLRHADAAREFEAMLDVDPVSVAGHYNLMLSLQRLNQLTLARREETMYRLLAPPDAAAQPARGTRRTPLEAQPLHEHRLEAVR